MGPKSATQNLSAGLWVKAETQFYRVNNRRNSSSERRRPSSVRTSDFDLFTGSQISPFSCNRSIVAQSNPFQAQHSLWSVSHNSARTASSILSSSISILPCYHARHPQVPRPTSDGYFKAADQIAEPAVAIARRMKSAIFLP